jgi:hypothetical protein
VIGADTVRGQVIESTRIGNGSSESRIVTLRLEDLWEIQLDEVMDLVRESRFLSNRPRKPRSIGERTRCISIARFPLLLPPACNPIRQPYIILNRFYKNVKCIFIYPWKTIAGFITRGTGHVYIPENPIGKAHFPLLFTFLPIMKGIPDSALNAQFKVQVRPLFKNLGKVFFLLKTPSGIVPIENAQIFLDDKPISLEGQESINLEPGLKGFRIEVSGYPPFQTTVAVERGKVVTIEAIFMKREAKVHMNAPLGTRIFIDGSRLP